jgi:hypothetical protein
VARKNDVVKLKTHIARAARATSFQMAEGDPRRKSGEALSSLRPRGPFNFVPLATSDLRLVAELEVLLLRPEPPGRLVTQGGDIDNRLKTLFDALCLPQVNGLPRDDQPAADEHPFFCVLEDDNLVSSVHVRTEHLLTRPDDDSHVSRSQQSSAKATWTRSPDHRYARFRAIGAVVA